MSDDKGTGSGEKTFTQKDIEVERGHVQHWQQQFKEAETKAKELEGKYGSLQSELESLKVKTAKTPEDQESVWKERETRIRGEVAADLDKWKTTAEKNAAKVKELTVTTRLFSAHKDAFNDDVHDDVKERIRRYVDLDENEAFIVRDDKGEVRYSKANPSKPMTAEEFVAELQESKPSWVRPTGKGGTKQPGTKLPPSNGSIGSFADLKKLPDQGKQWMMENPDQLRELLSK